MKPKLKVEQKNISKDTKSSAPCDSSQVVINTFEKSNAYRVRSEVDEMTKVETRVQDAILAAMENLVILKVELLKKSVVKASSGRDFVSIVPDPDQRDFTGNIEGLQMTASSRMNSNTNLNKIVETRVNITVEGSDLSLSETSFDR